MKQPLGGLNLLPNQWCASFIRLSMASNKLQGLDLIDSKRLLLKFEFISSKCDPTLCTPRDHLLSTC